MLIVGIYGFVVGGEGGIVGIGLGYIRIEFFRELGFLVGIGLGGFCFGLLFRNGFMIGG